MNVQQRELWRRPSLQAWISRFSATTLLLVPVWISGCATQQPVEAWKIRVTRYISEQGNGDPNVLRDLADARARDAVRPDRVMIGEFGVKGPARGGTTPVYDVQGILIGHYRAADRFWFVFLVGVLRQQTSGPPVIEDVRLAAMTAIGRELRWVVSDPDDIATRRYISPSSTAPADPAYRIFPKATDLYRTVVQEDRVNVFEDRSGANWNLRLPPPSAPPRQRS